MEVTFLATKFTIISKSQAEAAIYAASLSLEHIRSLVPVPLPCRSNHKRTGTFPCVELPTSTMGTQRASNEHFDCDAALVALDLSPRRWVQASFVPTHRFWLMQLSAPLPFL